MRVLHCAHWAYLNEPEPLVCWLVILGHVHCAHWAYLNEPELLCVLAGYPWTCTFCTLQIVQGSHAQAYLRSSEPFAHVSGSKFR